jgi:hypothetical protein
MSQGLNIILHICTFHFSAVSNTNMVATRLMYYLIFRLTSVTNDALELRKEFGTDINHKLQLIIVYQTFL